MTHDELDDTPETSLFTVGTSLLINWRPVLMCAMAGALIALLIGLIQSDVYVASASFVPQGSDPNRSSLASLAGQFGVSLPSGTQSLSPDFYAQLLKSRVLLLNIARDTFAVPEVTAKPLSLIDLFRISGNSRARREEEAVRRLTAIINTSVSKTTGIVQVTVESKWPSVSLSIANALVNGVDDFNQRTRQGQAAAERKFVEGRVALASSDLRSAEDRLQTFLQANRDWERSPELSFVQERLKRDLSLRQQVFTSLTQSLEDVRIREVRDTPVITVIEPPMVASTPLSRRILRRLIVGALLGGVIATLLGYFSYTISRRRKEGDPQVGEFLETVAAFKTKVLRALGRLRVSEPSH